MLVTSVRESDQEACVGNSSHDFEKPLRVERSRGRLRTLPARRINFLVFLSPRRTRSSCSRTICPCDIPVRADFSRSQLARGFGTRIVIVLPIRHNCNTHQETVNGRWGKRQVMSNPPSLDYGTAGESAPRRRNAIFARQAIICVIHLSLMPR